MIEQGFHFAQPLWLLGCLVVPLVWLWLRFTSVRGRRGLEFRYADPELLPHLQNREVSQHSLRGRAAIGWSAAWLLLMGAMAGPRWDYQQVHLFTPGTDLVVLFDISRSMNVRDVAPSRIVRARQEIEDLVRRGKTLPIGLVAFASVAHVVSPITEDTEGLLQQLPAISTDLTRLQGSRLSGALQRGLQLFAGQPAEVAHNLLLISDGGFADEDLNRQVADLHEAGTRLHVLAVGDERGGLVPGVKQPHMVDHNGAPVISRLESKVLRRLAETGGGVYRIADYRDGDTTAILDAIADFAQARKEQNVYATIWRERFHWLLLPAVFVLLVGPRLGKPALPIASGSET